MLLPRYSLNQGIWNGPGLILRGGNMWLRRRHRHESPQQSTQQSFAALRKETAPGGRPVLVRHGTQETTSALPERCRCRRRTTGIVPDKSTVTGEVGTLHQNAIE
jgi:hypothetical protein